MPAAPPRTSNAPLALALVLVASCTFAFPAYLSRQNQQLIEKSEGKEGLSTYAERNLSVGAVRRGPFINSGSRDVGRDASWDKDGKGYLGYKGQPKKDE